ncbi:MAG: hypothetical protein OXK78_18200, partial [Caldilineaceae bacterium]|nr:hypothetical protein [Caldilineaceae bacterium]
KQRQPPLALIPRQTVPTPNLGCTHSPHGLDTTGVPLYTALEHPPSPSQGNRIKNRDITVI